MPPAKTLVACFEKPMTSIRNAAEEKLRPKRKIFRSNISHCWTGTTKSSSRRERVPKKPTRSLNFRDWGKRSGSAKIRMSMSAGFAEAGSEPDFLGHEFVHLSDRGIW